MPAVPAATVIITTASTSSSSPSTNTVQRAAETQSFTVLPDDEYEYEYNETLHPINIIESDDDDDIEYLHDSEEEEEEESYEKKQFGRPFCTSRPDHQSITTSNVYLLQRKLMDLSQSKGNQKEERLFTRTNGYLKAQTKGYVKVNNKLKEQKQLSKSHGEIHETTKKPLKKSSSKSYSNLQKNKNNKSNNIYNNTKDIFKGYHRNCYTSTSIYSSKNNMTSTIRQTHVYNRNFTDHKPQQNGFADRRKSSPESDQSMSPISNSNNNINIKNRQNENNNKYQQYNNTKNSMNSRLNNNNNKPLFVTTVKTGKFLDPPPELAYLFGLNNSTSAVNSSNDSSNSLESSTKDKHQQQVLLYSFSSQPRVLHQHHHKARCDAAKAVKNNNYINQQRTRRDTNATLNNTDGSEGDKKNNKDVDDGPVPYGNIMFDRRVVRGSTFAQHPIPTDGESQAARQQEARRRALARRRAQGQQTRQARYRLGTPPPVAGRRHENVQTEKYLEEIFDRPPENDIGVQTDLFLDRPPSPFYIPAKTGMDAETQIYPGDLFDFDIEVQPILEVLVGKTIEQAMIEVLEEEEMAALRAQQRRFMERRAAEKAEELRLEEQERRLREEKERRIAEHKRAMQEQKETEERIAAAVLTHGYLADLLPSVLDGLKQAGFLLDDIKVDVTENFMPWLMKEVQQEMDNLVSSRDILTDMVRDILQTRAEIYRALGEKPETPSEVSIRGEGEEDEEIPFPMNIDEGPSEEPGDVT